MFEKVLVSMDLSPATEALVSALPDMRELGTREFLLVHAAKPLRGPTSESLGPSGGVPWPLERLGGPPEGGWIFGERPCSDRCTGRRSGEGSKSQGSRCRSRGVPESHPDPGGLHR